jgi:hypothetical protein
VVEKDEIKTHFVFKERLKYKTKNKKMNKYKLKNILLNFKTFRKDKKDKYNKVSN